MFRSTRFFKLELRTGRSFLFFSFLFFSQFVLGVKKRTSINRRTKQTRRIDRLEKHSSFKRFLATISLRWIKMTSNSISENFGKFYSIFSVKSFDSLKQNSNSVVEQSFLHESFPSEGNLRKSRVRVDPSESLRHFSCLWATIERSVNFVQDESKFQFSSAYFSL